MQYEQFINDKKQNDTISQKSSQNEYEQFQDQGSIQTQNNKNVTTINRILTYFKFYQQFLKQNFYEFLPHQIEDSKGRQINKLLQALKKKQSQDSINQENLPFTQQLNKNTIQFLQSYQSIHRQKLQQKLLNSDRFKKVDTFTSQLLIDDTSSTKYCQIVKLGVQILWYRTQILILNNLQINPLIQLRQASQSGSFGLIYFVKVFGQDLSIKCIALQKRQKEIGSIDYKSNVKIISSAIKQFFFLLLFSELQTGPKTKKIGGFDMMIDYDHIQFATEICKAPKTENPELFRQEITQNLLKMHMLKIVHRDIKPSNIMYSPTFGKNVFIDFGCSSGLKETIGQKKLTKFAGATAFCSPEMFTLLTIKFGLVDLYFNDIFSLKQSFDSHNPNSLNKNEINIFKIKSSIFEIYKMKFNLYEGNYKEFYETWKQVSKNYPDEIDDIQIKLLYFFKDIKLTSQLRNFYWSEIKENIREMDEYKKLNMMMRNRSYDLLSEVISFPFKQKQFKYFQVLFQIIKVQYGDYTPEQIEIEKVLVAKDRINDYLNAVQINLQSNKTLKINEQEKIKLSLIVVFYATFAQNKYRASVQNKIKACNLGLKILFKKDNSIQEKVQKLPLNNGMQRLYSISKFYKKFLFKLWKKVPEKYRQKSAINSLITVFLLGDTVNLTALSSFLYTQQTQSSQKSEKTYKKSIISNSFQSQIDKENAKISRPKRDWKFRLNRICYFWQFQLIFILFQKMLSNEIIVELQSSLNCIRYKAQKIQAQWMQEDLQNKVLKVNKKFYQQLIINYKNFNQVSFDFLLAQLQSPQIIQSQNKSSQVKKWRSLMQIILCCFVFVYCTSCSIQILMSLSSKLIFDHWQKDNIFSYGICLFLYKGVNSQIQSEIFTKIQDIINFKEIGLKFCLYGKLQLSLEQSDGKTIEDITQIVKKQINVKKFEFQTNQLFICLVRILKNFLDIHVQSLSILSQEFLILLKKCYGLVQLAWEVCLNYKKIQSLQKIRKTPNKQITSYFIEKILKKDQLVHSFYSYIFSLGQLYRIVSYGSKKMKNRIQIPQKYIEFFKWLSINRQVFNFTSQWLQIIKSNKKIKQIMKSNRLLLILFVNFYFQDRRTITEILKGEQVISDLFEKVCPDNFYITSKKKNIPSLQVSFDYLQIKLIKTVYAFKQCEKMIELYKISVTKNNFSMVFEKKGLLRFIFNSYIYTQQPFQQLWKLMYHLSKSNTLHPNKFQVKIFTEELEKWFWCLCRNCFPRYPQSWKPQLFTQYLYQRINQWNPLENPYMALVYFYSMNNKSLRPQVIQKFIKKILKSVKLLLPIARRKILSRMYFYVYLGFFAGQKNQIFFNPDGSYIDQNTRFSKSERNNSIHRRLIHSYSMLKKYEQNLSQKLQVIAEKRFIKQFYFYDYKYPKLIRQKYKKKLMRYYEIKQNCMKVSVINQILQSNNGPFLQSLKKSKNR